MRLIDAEQMKKKLNEWIDATGCDVFTKHHIMEFLNGCDAVEAVPVVHGGWVKAKYDAEYECSNCHCIEYECLTKSGFKLPNFCPNCGAKMTKQN